MILALLAVAGLVPILTASGGADDRLQVAHSAWIDAVVWNSDAGPPGLRTAVVFDDLQRRAFTQDTSISPDPTAEPAVEATATPVPTATPEPWATMTIREGDTLFDLALWFGLRPGDIARFNGLDIGGYVVVGQTVAIPIPESQMVMPPEPVLEEPPAVVAEVPEPEPVPEPAAVATAPPTPVPTPPPPPVYSGTTDDVIAAICSFAWDCDKMVSIAMCESGLNPNAYNPAGYYGLFQINYEFAGWNDPYTNAKVAYEQKYLPALQHGGNGYSPWPYCQYY